VNGSFPYTYSWDVPAGLTGAGPFKIWIKDTAYLKVEISDAVNASHSFMQVLRTDTIDSLTYDYRKPYFGIYRCSRTIYFYDYTGELSKTESDTLDVNVYASVDFKCLGITKLYYGDPLAFHHRSGLIANKRNNGNIYSNGNLFVNNWFHPAGGNNQIFIGKKIN
jgi:hypothetical protein